MVYSLNWLWFVQPVAHSKLELIENSGEPDVWPVLWNQFLCLGCPENSEVLIELWPNVKSVYKCCNASSCISGEKK